MRKRYRQLLTMVLLASFLLALPFEALATEGTLGYQGGISIENRLKKDEYQYSEMIFVTGKPILMTGTLTIKKTVKNDVITATYTYKLTNSQQNASMNRVVMTTTTRETKTNGQITETTQLSRAPTETITIGGQSYRLVDSSFTRSVLTDPKAAINYQAGEFIAQKTYVIGNTVNNPDTVKVSLSGRLYAYDQFWSSTQTQKISVLVETELKSANPPVQWGGSAEMVISSATRHQLYYSENEPDQISFEGGYVQSKWTESTLDYTARFPEFDRSGRPTDVLVTYADSQSLITPPETHRLMVPDLKHLNGHWSQEPIAILYGLEVIPGTGSNYRTTALVTRREFVTMLVRALKDIPEDPNAKNATTTTTKKTNNKTPEVSPFVDVKTDDPNYEEIKKAYTKGIVQGDGYGRFNPNAYVTKAEAVKMIVSALGLENLAPYPTTVTPFTDNDQIPGYARNSAAVAHTLGIISPDDRGRFNAGARLTHEDTALLLYNLIVYMGDELIKDYRDRMAAF